MLLGERQMKTYHVAASLRDAELASLGEARLHFR